MNKRILISLSVIGVAAAIAVGGTIAYFSDTETSVGNTFTAGAIDLQIDNESYVTNEDGVLAFSGDTSWELKDLGKTELFFNFSDLKPGDIGEDTISLHVNSNDAWACMNIALTGTPENNQTEPEVEVDSTTGDDEGELQNELYFAFWADDGDNVFEDDEEIFAEGLAAGLFDGMNLALADSTINRWLDGGPLQGGMDEGNNPYVYHIGKVWCYGALTEEPADDGDGTPLERSTTGFECDGKLVSNASQTDGIEATVEFYAEQARNNSDFTCAKTFVQTPQLSDQNAENQAAGNRPYITWDINGQCIDLTFHNPFTWKFWFDYRVDGESGDNYNLGEHGIDWDDVISQGECSTQPWGQHYNLVGVDPAGSETVHVCGQNEILTGLRLGPEQNYYLDWISFLAQ